MLRAVLFDLDGTLADTERQNAEAVACVLARRGRRITEEERLFVVGHGWAEIHEHLASGGALGLSSADLIAEATRERAALVARDGVVRLPGAVDAARWAAARFASTIVSGSSRAEITLTLERLGLGQTFPWFVASEDTSRGKPSPDGYLLAAERLGVRPTECLVVEDSAAGIAAGRAAGMVVLAVRAGNFARQPQDDAHAVVESLLELDAALVARLGRLALGATS